MGQQQLLLLVLGIVIVGLAVVVGIQAFSENQEKANEDARVNDGVRIASDVQAWALKPAAFGGNGGTLATPDFADNLGYDEDANGDYANPNGVYDLGDITNGTMITATNPNGDAVYVLICGFDADDISTQVAGTAPTTC
ncbi:MAG: hypothetical protein AAGI52_06185 [Bacteroidota bacterium]